MNHRLRRKLDKSLRRAERNKDARTQVSLPVPLPDPPMNKLAPLTQGQLDLITAIASADVVFALGPAGTGKTAMAISAAALALDRGYVEKIMLTRPAVDAGEKLGFLPGDTREKMAPFLRPLYDELTDRFGARRLQRYLIDGTVEIAPIGFMRGRTLKNAFIVADEVQNCTTVQLKMVLTRLGSESKMVLTGDPDQSDLIDGSSGLDTMATRLSSVVPVIRLGEADIVRHPLVRKMLAVMG